MENQSHTLVVLPYLNAHLGEFILYMNDRNNVDFYIMGKSENFRKAFLNEIVSEHIRVVNYSSILRKLFSKKYSTVVFHGIFYLKFLPLIILLRNSKTYLLSEAFNSKNYSRVSTIFKKGVCQLLNYSAGETHLIALGSKFVKLQYEELGLRFDFFEQSAYLPKLIGSYDKNLKMKDGKIRLAFIGQFIERKNIRLLKRLLNSLQWKKLQDQIEIYIIGDGDKNYFQNSNKNVIVFNNKNNKQILTQLEEIDVLILPSFFDGWGAVVNEAISRGCALLLSKHVGAGEIFLEEGENGFLVSSDNYLDIIDRLNEWVLDPTQLVGMQAKSYELFQHHHRPEVQYKFLN